LKLAPALLVACLIGCSTQSTPATPVDAGPPPPPPEVTLLITGDESGWLLPAGDTGKEKGGAAETLARWTTTEHHCDGPLGAAGAPACPEDGTLVLSTGDHGPGPAISALFYGQPMAEAMKQMGYAASAFGKLELDFGRDVFNKNRTTGAFPYLAANLKAKDPAKGLDLPAFKTFKRRGFTIAVIGLVNLRAPETTMPGRFEGLEVEPYEAALSRTVPEAWKANADAVVILADVCPADLKPILEKHADWNVTAAAAGHCHDRTDVAAGSTPISYVGRRFEQYVSITLGFDGTKPAQERVTKRDVKHVEVAAGQGAPYANTALAIVLDGWKKKLDTQLGEKIGVTKTGLEQDSPMMAKWLTGAWRDAFKADVALLNRKGIRQDLPPGEITKSSVQSVLAFDNSLFVCKLKGADLSKELSNKEAIFGGASKGAGKGNFIYVGGDGFHLDKADPNALETGMSWQTPVIDWTKKQQTTAAAPLEKKLK
jgi:5'-nucleotidase/UDP-sugar diphosphatase